MRPASTIGSTAITTASARWCDGCVSGRREAVNPAKTGTKAAAHYVLDVPGGGSKTVRLRLAAARLDDAFGSFEGAFRSRIADADEFYERIAPASLSEDPSRAICSRFTEARTPAACSPPITEMRAFGHIQSSRGSNARPHMP